MRNRIIRLVAVLGLSLGALAGPMIQEASATPSPPLNTLYFAGAVGWYTSWTGQQTYCQVYVQQGNSSGVAYAKIARIGPNMCYGTSEPRGCHVDFNDDDILLPDICRYMVRVAYRMPNGSTGAAFGWLPAGSGDLNWGYAIGPAGSTILSSQIYSTAYTQAMCNCDPLVVDADPTYGVLSTIDRYYTGV